MSSIEIMKSTNGKSVEDLNAILADPGFGVHFTDHMFISKFDVENGWHDSKI